MSLPLSEQNLVILGENLLSLVRTTISLESLASKFPLSMDSSCYVPNFCDSISVAKSAPVISIRQSYQSKDGGVLSRYRKTGYGLSGNFQSYGEHLPQEVRGFHFLTSHSHRLRYQL